MKNLHRIRLNTFDDVHKAYQVFWNLKVRFSRSDKDIFEHETTIARGDYWYRETSSYKRLAAIVLPEWIRKGQPEPDYTKMDWID